MCMGECYTGPQLHTNVTLHISYKIIYVRVFIGFLGFFNLLGFFEELIIFRERVLTEGEGFD